MFANLKIGSRQAIGFGVMLALFLVICAISIVRINGLNYQIKDIVSRDVPQLTLAARSLNNYQNSARTLRNITLTDDLALIKQEKEKFDKADRLLKEETEKLEKLLDAEKEKEVMARVRGNLTAIDPHMDKAMKAAMSNDKKTATTIIFGDIIPIQGKLLADLDTLMNMQIEAANNQANEAGQGAKQAVTILLIIGAVGLLIGFAAAFIISRSVTKPIKSASEGLTEAAEQVASAAAQVSSASQQLAEGSSEQAASVEETSSSLEEISSMTKQNAGNAGEASALVAETGKVVDIANDAMKELTVSMADISTASEETAKIIKTIDEIAFQTNLLALSAAVEAARAGEAGAGFAVVADEVRNLAMRAADAAKNTASLIEGTVKKIKTGSDIVARTNDACGKVSSGAKKVNELVAEIAAASQEQSEGIEQVRNAVGQMDKVVQQNAANAEESASASEEMSAQAEQMKSLVVDLMALVEDVSRNGRAEAAAAGRKTSRRQVSAAPFLRAKKKAGALPAPKEIAVLGKDDEFTGKEF